MKKIIGIVPASFIGNPDESCMQDHYKLLNNYVKRVTEAGCIPICLAPSDNLISEDALDMCDGFLVQGGAQFYPYHFQVIHHAVTRQKRYLGICLGNQLIYVYFGYKEILKKQGYEGDTVKGICALREGGMPTLLERVEGHRSELPSRGCEDKAKHDVEIVSGTLLHRLIGKDTMRLCSFHSLAVPAGQSLVTVNAWSNGVAEGCEYTDRILGIQGHPEADNLLSEIFTFLAED